MKNLVFPRIFLHCVALGFIVSGLLLSTRCGFDSRTGRCGMISRNREIIPFFIYASNEPKSVLARNLGDCRDNLRNSQSVFLIVGNLINNFLLVLLENRNFMRGEFTCGFGGSC